MAIAKGKQAAAGRIRVKERVVIGTSPRWPDYAGRAGEVVADDGASSLPFRVKIDGDGRNMEGPMIWFDEADLIRESEHQAMLAADPKGEPKAETKTKTKAPTERLKNGDMVMVSPTVQYPRYGWGSVKPGDIGVITDDSNTDYLRIDFPKQHGWAGDAREMVAVRTPKAGATSAIEAIAASARAAIMSTFRKGDRVRILDTKEPGDCFEPGDEAILTYRDGDGDWWGVLKGGQSNGSELCLTQNGTIEVVDHVPGDFESGERVVMVRKNTWAEEGETGVVRESVPGSDLDCLVQFDTQHGHTERCLYTASRDLRHDRSGDDDDEDEGAPAAQAPDDKDQAKAKVYDRLAYMIKWEADDLDEADAIALFQDLIDSGMAWRFGGCYADEAERMVASGKCRRPVA